MLPLLTSPRVTWRLLQTCKIFPARSIRRSLALFSNVIRFTYKLRYRETCYVILKILEQQSHIILLGLLLTIIPTSEEITNWGWWKHTVFYQIYPRSFMDSDNDDVDDLEGKRKRRKSIIHQALRHCVIYLPSISSSIT